MEKLITTLLFANILLWGDTGTAEPLDQFSSILSKQSFSYKTIQGSINKVPIEFAAVQIENKANFHKTLTEALKNKRTVNVEPTPMGNLFIIADVQSTQCPLCTPLSKHTDESLLKSTYTLSELRLSNGSRINLASNGYETMEATKSVISESYLDGLFSKTRKKWKVNLQMLLEIEKVQSGSIVTTYHGALSEAKASLVSDLLNKGYRPMNPNSSVGREIRETINLSDPTWNETFVLDDSVIGISLSPTNNPNETQVTINEANDTSNRQEK